MQTETTSTFQFYRQPFVVLTSSLCIGIFLGFNGNEWQDLLPIFGITLLALAIVLQVRGLLQNSIVLLLAFFSFMLIGAFHVQEKTNVSRKYSVEDVYQKGDAVLVRLKEITKSTKEWKKMTGEIQMVYGQNSEHRIVEPLVLFVQSENFGFESGDEILITADLTAIKNAGNPGEFDAVNYWSKKGFHYMAFVGDEQYRVVRNKEASWITKKLSALRIYLNDALENNLRGTELSIAKALILGDKSLLEVETRNSFSNTGAMHVLAVSGLHIGIIMQILLVILSRFSAFISKKYAVFTVVLILWIYAFVTGLSPSVVRAVFMFSMLFLSQVIGKQYNPINVLFFTAFVILLYNPLTLFDIGFQLSFLAMVGIFLFYRPIEQLVYIENKTLRKVWQGTAIGFGAQLMTTPITLYYFHQFPNYFVLTNIGLMVTSGLILGIGIFLFSISWWKLIAAISGAALSLVIFISFFFIEWVEQLPGGLAQGFEISFILVFCMSMLILLLFLKIKKRSHKFFAYTIGLGLIILMVSNRYDNLTKSELVVFNARQVIVTVRKNDRLFCFYQAKPGDFDKVKFTVEGYLKLHPSKVKYYALNKSDWNIRSKKTQIQTRKVKNNYIFSLNGKDYLICLNDQSNVTQENLTTIGMPWIDSKVNHSLQDGAFVRGL